MILTLTGMMGCGKSSVGKALAKRLGRPFLDLDAVIEKRSGRPIPTLFAEEGEAAFRQMEREALEDLLSVTDPGAGLILALGGGTLTDPDCASLVRERTCCLYLEASADTLLRRLQNQTEGRPLLRTGNPGERLTALLAQRRPVYESTAHHIIPTDARTVSDCVKAIAALLLSQTESIPGVE